MITYGSTLRRARGVSPARLSCHAMRSLRDPEADADADATTPASPEHTVTATEGDAGVDDGSGLRVKIGDVVGRHFLVAELGQGGMGRVFAAHDGGLDRTVAIKFITVVNEAMIERFLAEARVTARCTHPNIVGVHEIGRHQGPRVLATRKAAQLQHEG